MAQDPKSALLEKMNVYLANQQVNYFKTLSMHWYIKGKSFFVLHKKQMLAITSKYLRKEFYYGTRS